MPEVPFYKNEKYLKIIAQIVAFAGVLIYIYKQFSNIKKQITDLQISINNKDKLIQSLLNQNSQQSSYLEHPNTPFRAFPLAASTLPTGKSSFSRQPNTNQLPQNSGMTLPSNVLQGNQVHFDSKQQNIKLTDYLNTPSFGVGNIINNQSTFPPNQVEIPKKLFTENITAGRGNSSQSTSFNNTPSIPNGFKIDIQHQINNRKKLFTEKKQNNTNRQTKSQNISFNQVEPTQEVSKKNNNNSSLNQDLVDIEELDVNTELEEELKDLDDKKKN